MKKTVSFIAATLLTVLTAQAALASCDHSWQTASDGSNCGDRAADRRPGGR